MIYIILYIQTAILFYLIGKYTRVEEIDIMNKVSQTKKRFKKKPKSGVLPFKTTEELEYEKSGEKAIEDEWKKAMSKMSEESITP